MCFLHFPVCSLRLRSPLFWTNAESFGISVWIQLGRLHTELFLPGIFKMLLAPCAIGWVGYARVMRGQVLKVREYDFVQAAKALGPEICGFCSHIFFQRSSAAYRSGLARHGRSGFVRSHAVISGDRYSATISELGNDDH